MFSCVSVTPAQMLRNNLSVLSSEVLVGADVGVVEVNWLLYASEQSESSFEITWTSFLHTNFL